MQLPPIMRSRRALGVLAIVAVAAVVLVPDVIARGLPYLLLLVCPLMMVFMMRPMHSMPAAVPPRPAGDPYAPEALTRRLAELETERAAITALLVESPSTRSVDPQSPASVRAATARAERA